MSPTSLRGQTGSRPDSAIVELSLAEARALAMRQNPEILAARLTPAIARGELQQARTIRANPDASIVAGASPEIMVTQEIEWAGQRGLRAAAARAGVTRAEFNTADAGRVTLTDVSIAYHRSVAAAARRRLVSQLVTFTDRLITAVRIQLAEGEISTLEANLAEIENGRVRARVVSARRQAVAADLALKRLLGLAPGVALRLTDSATAPLETALREDSLTARALTQRPDLQEAAAAAEVSRQQLSLAKREAIPSLRVGGRLEPGGEGGGVGLAVGVSLPILNRNRGTIAAREAEARQTELRRAAVAATVRAEVAAAMQAVLAAGEELRLYQESVLEPARANAGLLEEAYRAGKIPLSTLLLLRNQLLDAEFGYWEAWLARREALVLLESAIGSLTPPIDSGAPPRGTP